MKILHYSLGVPPYRSGGLTKYSIDLMKAQVKEGHKVSLLYPGKIKVMNKKIFIKNDKTFQGIKVFELNNPLPVPLMGGVCIPSEFMEKSDGNIYKKFLKDLDVDIIHIHTLMGIHLEFFLVAKELGIKLIFTSHDYYGICPKVNLIDSQLSHCEDYQEGNKCVICNLNAYSIPLVFMMQSHLYKKMKNNSLVIKASKLKKKKISMKSVETINDEVVHHHKITGLEFVKLRNYYLDILNMMDKIHYNSKVAENVYSKYVPTEGEYIPITHSDIKDKRIKKNYSQKKNLQIGFLGPIDEYKGFPLLHNSLGKLLDENIKNWHLKVYGNSVNLELDREKDYISFNGKYNHNELDEIFQHIDILIIPSIWKETFGFIGLEALANGVPLIVSSNVGIKDFLLDIKGGRVVEAKEEELVSVIKDIIENREKLSVWNQNICNNDFTLLMKYHVKCLTNIYKEMVEVE